MKIPKISPELLSTKAIRNLMIRLEKDTSTPYFLIEEFRRIYEKRREIDSEIWKVSNEARWFFDKYRDWFSRKKVNKIKTKPPLIH